MKRMRGKSLLVILVILAISVMAVGCGGNNGANEPSATGTKSPEASGTASPSQAVKKDPVELTLTVPNTWSEFAGIKEIIALYEKESGNKIKLDIYPEDQYYNLLKTKIQTNDAPDVIAAGFGQEKIPYSYLEPLNGPWIDKMLPSIKNKATMDGKVYEAYANPIGYLGVIYNKAVFAKAGVNVPLMNYQQLMDAVKKIQAIGVTPIFMGGKESWTYEMIPALGGISALKKDPALAQQLMENKIKPSQSPALVEMAKRTLSLLPYMNKNHMSSMTNDGLQGIADGKYAMTFLGDWLYDEFKKVSPEHYGDVSIMPITLDDEYISAIGTFSGKAFGVPNNSKHKAEAQKFVNFVMEPDHYKVVIKPFSGQAPYVGYFSELNPWQVDINKIIDQYKMPTTNSYMAESLGTFNIGNASQAFQDIFAGKDITQAYDDWYKDYERLNRSNKTKGW